MFIVFDMENKNNIGLIEINKKNNNPTYEIGIILENKYHRRNFPEKILGKIIKDYSNIHDSYELTASVEKGNFPINIVLEKFNFQVIKEVNKLNYWSVHIGK